MHQDRRRTGMRAAVVASLVLAGCSAPPPAAPPSSQAPGPTDRVGALAQQAFVGIDKSWEITSGFGSVWVSGFAGEMGDGTVTRVDPATNSILATIPVSSNTGGIAADDTSLWIVDGEARAIREIDPATNALTRRSIPIPGDGGSIVKGGGSLWFVGWDAIGPVDPATGTFTPVPQLGGCGDGCGFVAADDAVYKLSNDLLIKFDPARKQLLAKNSEDVTGSLLALGKNGLYAASSTASVALLDLETLKVTQTFTAGSAIADDGGKWTLGNAPGAGGQSGHGALVADDTGTWVRFSPSIIGRVEPASATIRLYGPFPSEADGASPILVAEGSLWVTNQGAGSGGADGGKPGIYRLALPTP